MASLQGFDTPVPAKIALMAFQNNKSSNEYDVTNIVLATLNTAALPDKTITVATEDEDKGSVSITYNDAVSEETTLSVPMNSAITATAEAKEGWEFSCWKNAAGEIVSYSPVYNIRLYDDLSITAEFTEAEYDPITTYVYKEDFSTLTTGTLAGAGWTSTNAQDSLTIESDSDHGNYIQFAPGNANSRGMTTDFGVDESSDYAVEFDVALTAGNNQETALSVINDAATNGINDTANNYIFQLFAAASSTTWTINGTDQSVVIPAGTWVHVKLTVGTDDNVGVVITNGDTELYNGTVAAVGGTSVKGIHLRSGRYNAVTLLDNVKVYTTGDTPTDAPTDTPTDAPTDTPTDAPTETPTESTEPTEEPTPDVVTVGTPVLTEDGKVSVDVTNASEDEQPVILIVVSYDENGNLDSLHVSESETVASGSTTLTADAPTTENYKVLVWDSLGSADPLMNFVNSLGQTE